MRRKALTALAVALTIAFAAPSAGQAATPAKTLGPAPQNSDCLSWNSPTQGCYYGIIGGIDYAVSAHLVRVGEKFSGSASGFSNDPWSWHHPPGVKDVECFPDGGGPGPHNGTCFYTAATPTGGWRPGPEAGGRTAASSVFFGAAIHCCTIGTYIAGDYLAIVGPDEYPIDGTVVDEEGNAITSGTVSIVGESNDGDAVDVFSTIDGTGYYHALLEGGSYTVSGSANGETLCLAEVKTQCIEQKKVSPTAHVDFRGDGLAEVKGTITNIEGKPVKGAILLVTDEATGKPVADGDTDAQGKYEIDIDEGGTYRVVPVHDEDVFEPGHKVFSVETGEEETADFKGYDPIKVQIESGFVRAPENDFLTRVTVKNQSPKSTVTGLEPVNSFAVRIAQNAYPPEKRGSVTVKQLIPLGRPQPDKLDPGESWSADIRITAETAGLVGLRAKFSGKLDINGKETTVSDSHDAIVTIEDPDKDKKGPDPTDKAALASQAINLFLEQTAAKFREIQKRRARQTYEKLRKEFSPEQEKMWFGSTEELKVTKTERALALAMGVPPEQVALATPKGQKGKDLTAVDEFAIYKGFRAEFARKAAFDLFDGAIAKPAAGIYAAGANEWRYWSQLGDPEGKAQIATDMALYAQLQLSEARISKNALIHAFVGTGAEANQSLGESRKAIGTAIENAGEAFRQAVAKHFVDEHEFNTKLADLAAVGDRSGVKKMLAQRDTDIETAVSVIVAEEIFGETVLRVGAKVLKGGKAAVGTAVESIGAAEKGGAKAVAEATQIGAKGKAGLPTYFKELPEDARVAIGMDRLRGIGGISGKDASIARRNVAEVNKQLRAKFGPDVNAELYVRPVNPFEVTGAMAKVEAVGVKSVSPADTLLGASPKALGQPAIFKPTNPHDLPKWGTYTKAEQKELLERFDTRITEFNELHGTPAPGSKMIEMKKAIDGKVDITFEGQYESQKRVYSLELETRDVGGTKILSYKHLSINGDVLVDGKPRPIGVDLDDIMWGDGKGGRLTADQEDFADRLYDELGRKAAVEEGFSEPFHGQTLRRMDESDMTVEAFPSFAFYGLRHLPEKEARLIAKEIAERFNKKYKNFPDLHIDEDDVLKKIKGEFAQKAIKVTENDVIFGDLGISFADP